MAEAISGELTSLGAILGRQVEVAIEGIEAIILGELVAVCPEGWFVRAQETKLPRGLLAHTKPGPDPDSPLVFIPAKKILLATVGEKPTE